MPQSSATADKNAKPVSHVNQTQKAEAKKNKTQHDKRPSAQLTESTESRTYYSEPVWDFCHIFEAKFGFGGTIEVVAVR